MAGDLPESSKTETPSANLEIQELLRRVNLKLGVIRAKDVADNTHREFLRTRLPDLCMETIDSNVLARELNAKGVLTRLQLQKIEAVSTNYEKNVIIYDYIGTKEAIEEPFLLALKNTDNGKILKIIGELAN